MFSPQFFKEGLTNVSRTFVIWLLHSFDPFICNSLGIGWTTVSVGAATHLTLANLFVEVLIDSWKQCQDADVLIQSPSAMAGAHIAEALSMCSSTFPRSNSA